MLTPEEATQIHQSFKGAFMTLLNEQVSRTILTQVVTTGLLSVSLLLLSKILEPFIEEEIPADEGGTDGMDDLSDIIVTEQSNTEGDNDDERTSETEKSEPELSGNRSDTADQST